MQNSTRHSLFWPRSLIFLKYSVTKILIIFVVFGSTGWFWSHTLRVKDIRGVWVDDEITNISYKLMFTSDGNLAVYQSATHEFPSRPTFKLGWRITRGGSLVLIFTPEYIGRVSRFFGIPSKEIRKGLQGNQLFFLRDRGSIHIKAKKIGEIQLLDVRPLDGLKFRFVDDRPSQLMIGKRIFAQTWSGGGF